MLEEERREVLDFLTTDDHSDALNASLAKHLEGTNTWFFESAEFSNWMSQDSSSVLECVGEPGAGKTVLAGQAIRYLQGRVQDDETVLYLFCQHSKQAEQSTERLLLTLLRQNCVQSPDLISLIMPLYQAKSKTQQRPPKTDLVRILHGIVAQSNKVYLVIDALDECERSCCVELLGLVEQLSNSFNIKCLTIARRDPAIGALTKSSIFVNVEALTSDVGSYITANLHRLEARVRVNPQFKCRIEEAVVKAAGGL